MIVETVIDARARDLILGNDRFGDVTGDHALRMFAQRPRLVERVCDTVRAKIIHAPSGDVATLVANADNALY